MGGRTLAMLRWTNTWPGSRSRRVVSGARESEQPSQRMVGCWDLASAGNKSGLDSAVRWAQALLRSSWGWRVCSV